MSKTSSLRNCSATCRGCAAYFTRTCRETRNLSRLRYSLQCLGLLLIILLADSARAQLPEYGDISVKIYATHTNDVGWGIAEHLATITNHSPTQSHRVTLLLDSGWGGRYRPVYDESVKRDVELAPNTTVTISLFSHNAAGNTQVQIDGKLQKETPPVSNEKLGTLNTAKSNSRGLLLSQKTYGSGLTKSINFVEGLKNEEGELSTAMQTYEVPLSEWSANWFSYARFDGIVVTGEEWNAAPETVRSALLRYVERGGSLVILGTWQAPAQWQPRQGIIPDEELKAEEAGGSGSRTSLPTAIKAAPTQKPQPDLPIFYIGFGEVIVTGSLDPSKIAVNQWKRLKNDVHDSRPGGEEFYNLAGINKAFQIVERFGVPVRGLFALMLLFVLVIGPLNLIWLARRKRKIWLLWTVPAVSLLTCLVVAGFALFGEGWNATARTEALTILDESAHRAATIGWTAFYSPITPSDGLHFSYDTQLDPQFPENRYYGRRGSAPLAIDWTNDQHLGAGWMPARVPAFFKLRKSETRRERLNIRQEANGTVSLVNGLGAQISQIWWADGRGKIHSATNVPAGAQAALQATGEQATGLPSALRETFSQDWLTQFKTFAEQPQAVLMPNSYLAVLNGSPFVEEGLKNVKTRKARNLVYGIQGSN